MNVGLARAIARVAHAPVAGPREVDLVLEDRDADEARRLRLLRPVQAGVRALESLRPVPERPVVEGAVLRGVTGGGAAATHCRPQRAQTQAQATDDQGNSGGG